MLACPEIKLYAELKTRRLTSTVINEACAFDFYSIACDESADVSDASQLLISLLGVDDNHCVPENLLDLGRLKGDNNWQRHF